MSFYDYTEQLDTGVKAMNDEHKVLIDLMNQLFEQNKNKQPKPILLKTLVSLAEYTTKHFSDEEKYMASIQYKELAMHQQLHKKLLSTLAEKKSEFEKSSEQTLSTKLFDFLKFWLNAHIKGIDIKYGKGMESS